MGKWQMETDAPSECICYKSQAPQTLTYSLDISFEQD